MIHNVTFNGKNQMIIYNSKGKIIKAYFGAIAIQRWNELLNTVYLN